MRRWQDPRINHKNPDHVSAYLLCKQTTERPRVEQALAVLASQKMHHETSAKMSQDFFVIMKQPVEPEWLKDWSVNEEALRASCRVPEDCDLGGFWIVDGSCPRQLLGLGAKRLTFEDKLSRCMVADTGYKASASGAPVQAAAVAPAARTAARVATPPETIPGPEDLPANAVGFLTAEATGSGQTQPATPATAAPFLPPTKKQRVLKLLHSEEQASAEDREAMSVEDLLGRIKRAAKMNLMCTPRSAGSSSVYFWASQVVAALRSGGGRAVVDATGRASAAGAPVEQAAQAAVAAALALPGDEVHGTLAGPESAAPAPGSLDTCSKQYCMLKEHFAGFLLKTLYGCPCWNQLKPFVGIFKDLASLGCAVPCDLDDLETFATAAAADTKLCPQKFASSDLTARVRFFGSALYRDFLKHRARALLAAAKAAGNADQRKNFLQLFIESATSLEGDTNGEWAKQASWSASLFLDEVTDASKVDFVLGAEASTAAAAPASAARAPAGNATLERLVFVTSFTTLPTDSIHWQTVAACASLGDGVGESTTITWSTVRDVAKLILAPSIGGSSGAAFKGVRCPGMAGLLTFMTEASGLPTALQTDVFPVVAKTKLQASAWTDVPEACVSVIFVHAILVLFLFVLWFGFSSGTVLLYCPMVVAYCGVLCSGCLFPFSLGVAF